MVEEQARVGQALGDGEQRLVQKAAVDRKQILPVVYAIAHRVRVS